MIIHPGFYQQTTLLPVKASHTALGVCGEMLVSRLLADQGYRQLQSHKRGDLTVADPDGVILNIEVKTARRDRQDCWQFCLYKAGKTDHRRADVVVLLCVSDKGLVTPFVIPQSALTVQKVAIQKSPTIYSGRLAKFRQSIDRLTLSTEFQQ